MVGKIPVDGGLLTTCDGNVEGTMYGVGQDFTSKQSSIAACQITGVVTRTPCSRQCCMEASRTCFLPGHGLPFTKSNLVQSTVELCGSSAVQWHCCPRC